MHGSGNRVRLRSSARTSTGQVRENNEDNVNLWIQEDSVLAIVADGMGGAAAGEEASRLAVEAIQDGLVVSEQPVLKTLDHLADDTIAQKMRDTIGAANNDIMNRAANNPDFRGMGTTVTLAFVRDMHAIVAHVGDSRAYLVSKRDHKITQITADHSFVEALVAAGHITQEQAEDHPMKNVLYRALGQTEDIDVDVYHTRMRSGDRLVLCSDGLTRHVKSAEIADLALVDDEPDSIAERLINLANERGGEDNVSVVVILLEGMITSGMDELMQRPVDDDTIVLSEAYLDLDLDDTFNGEEMLDDSVAGEPRGENDTQRLSNSPRDSYYDPEDTMRADDLPDDVLTMIDDLASDEPDFDDTIPERPDRFNEQLNAAQAASADEEDTDH